MNQYPPTQMHDYWTEEGIKHRLDGTFTTLAVDGKVTTRDVSESFLRLNVLTLPFLFLSVIVAKRYGCGYGKCR